MPLFYLADEVFTTTNSGSPVAETLASIVINQLLPGAGCIKKWLKLAMISANVNQSEPRILYLIPI